MMTQLLGAWKTGNTAKLDKLLLRHMRQETPTLYQHLVVDRNRAWLETLDTLMETPEVEFVLTGVGHMPGRDGLLAQMRARGFSVEQLKPPAASKRRRQK
jgi:uncharacterized protein YbaP (TraB family)